MTPCRLTLQTLVLVVLAALLTPGCGGRGHGLDSLMERGALRFITRNGPSTYYLGRDGPTGFEYELAAAFAADLGVELVVKEAFTTAELFAAIDRGEADIAGAGLALTGQRALEHAASSAYAQQQPQVIYRVGDGRPRSLEDLRDKRIIVRTGSSHEEMLEELRDREAPWLSWEGVDSVDPLRLLQRVRDGDADAAVLGSRSFTLQQRLLPELAVAFDLGAARDVVWYLRLPRGDASLLLAVNNFLARQSTTGELERLAQRHFYRDDSFDRVDNRTFINTVNGRLDALRPLIEDVAEEHQLPWELLAAMSYQESHWDPQATSPTGVRGLMMLTKATAEDLGIDDRTDPAQSLRGGARYYKSLRRRLPKDIVEPERSLLALAAYNIGMAHLEDARVLTERRGGDPHLWRDVRNALPLLEDEEHYRRLRYGYARGREAARYVQNIRYYHEVLRLRTAQERRSPAPQNPADYLPGNLRELGLWIY